MVSIRNMASEKMSDAEKITLLMSLHREMVEMKRKNEEEIQAFRKKNEEMKKQLTEVTPSLKPDHQAGTSRASLPCVKTLVDPSSTRPKREWRSLDSTSPFTRPGLKRSPEDILLPII